MQLRYANQPKVLSRLRRDGIERSVKRCSKIHQVRVKELNASEPLTGVSKTLLVGKITETGASVR